MAKDSRNMQEIELCNDINVKRRQTTRVKRIRNDTIYTGTWNIMTLLKTGKMNEIAETSIVKRMH